MCVIVASYLSIPFPLLTVEKRRAHAIALLVQEKNKQKGCATMTHFYTYIATRLPLIDVPDPKPTYPPGVQAMIKTISGWIAGLGYGVALLAVLILGIGFMFFSLDEGPKSRMIKPLLYIAGGAVIIGSAGAIVRLLFGI